MKENTGHHIENVEIEQYLRKQKEPFATIGRYLYSIISKQLPLATVKIYYSMPVWFLEENPIVGFKAGLKNINLLFWSGKSFDENKLIPVGKFKAAQIKIERMTDLKEEDLIRWVKKAKKIIWNYKDIVKNKGQLTQVKVNGRKASQIPPKKIGNKRVKEKK
jgi:hypothetical protein